MTTTLTHADPQVDAVRSFNRFYTRVIGVLQDGLLRTPYTLTEARVIFELAQRDRAEVAALRRDLGLDAGYLSRMLAQFETAGLIIRERSATDGRRQLVALTDAGREVWRDLDRRSADEIAALLRRLGDAERQRLLGAMDSIARLLSAPESQRAPLVALRPPLSGELGWIVQRHGELYEQAHGWDATFEAMVAAVVADFGAGHDPAREAGWIADVDGCPVGSVLCVRRDDETAQLRVLLVDPATRGMGLGTRLVDECLRFARRAGYRRIVLATYSAMVEARRIYERAGFTVTSATPVHHFGQDLVEEEWSRDL
jgi:DNA-binding MarR family transcriptional regulator/GNAT superfamily N-acetyltransferase